MNRIVTKDVGHALVPIIRCKGNKESAKKEIKTVKKTKIYVIGFNTVPTC